MFAWETPRIIIMQALITKWNLVPSYPHFSLPRQFFKASVFTKLLQTDPYGRISIMQFFNYVMRKVWLHQTRIGLSLYDVAGQGYLKESVCSSNGFYVRLCHCLIIKIIFVHKFI